MLANGTLVINGGVGISKNLSINGNNINLGTSIQLQVLSKVVQVH
jgi:hypothetical protein